MQYIVLLYEGKRLYAGGSPKAAQMRTAKTSGIRTCHLKVMKSSLKIFCRCFPLINLLPYITSPPTHISGKEQMPRMLAPERALREAPVALEDDNSEVIILFLRCWARPDPLRLNVRTSAKCGRVIDAYLRSWPRRGLYPKVVRKSG